MHHANTALGNVSLPLKACFVLGKPVYIQFNGDSYEGHNTGGFVILDLNGVVIIWAGWYYSTGCTNNESKSFSLWDIL